MLKRFFFAGILWAGVLVPSSLWAWGQEAHRLITARALEMLPPALLPFYRHSRAFIVEHSVDPDFWRNVGFTEEVPRHFLDFDTFGPFPFAALPHDYQEAVEKYGLEMIQKNGVLPWRIEEIFDKLVLSFERLKKGNAPYALDDIRYFSAVLAHYVGDSHVPFHATANYDGQLTNQPGVHARFESELFWRYRTRIRVRPGPITPISQPREYIFKTLLESFQQVDPILKADKDAAVGRTEYDDAFFRKFSSVARPIMEHRINDSIRAVASMISSAWEKGGSPVLPLNLPRVVRKINNATNGKKEGA